VTGRRGRGHVSKGSVSVGSGLSAGTVYDTRGKPVVTMTNTGHLLTSHPDPVGDLGCD